MCDGARVQVGWDSADPAAIIRSRRFRGPPRPSGQRPALLSLYGTNFHRAPLLARLRRRSNGEIVSAADGSQENGLGRGSGEIGPGETRQARAAWSGAAAGGARPLGAGTATHDQAPASSPDAASLLRRRLLHTGHARDAQPRHLFPQVSARACWRGKVNVRMRPFSLFVETRLRMCILSLARGLYL